VTHPLVWGSIIGYNPQEGFSIQWQRDRPDSRIFFFLILLFLATYRSWSSKSGESSPKPLLFLASFSRNFQKYPLYRSQSQSWFQILAKFLAQKKKKSWSQSPNTYFAFWRNFAPKTNAGPSPQSRYCIWRNFTSKKHTGHSPKLISHFGETWTQKQKLGHSPKTDSAFWRNLDPKTQPGHRPKTDLTLWRNLEPKTKT